jgi:predicted DNA-binding transcriptional regulator AlpA
MVIWSCVRGNPFFQLLFEVFDMTKLLTREEVAEILGISTQSVDKWSNPKVGKLPPPIEMSRRVVRFRQSDIEKWLKSQPVKVKN